MNSYSKIGTLNGHTEPISHMLLTENEKTLYTTGLDNKIIIWNLNKTKKIV